MADLLLITPVSFPKRFQDTYEGFTIRPVTIVEHTAIEDWIFNQHLYIQLPTSSFAAVIPDVPGIQTSNEDYATIVEFSLSFFATKHFAPIIASVLLSDGKCSKVTPHRPTPTPLPSPDFSKSIKGAAVPQWLRRCCSAYTSDKKRIRITATRYLRYLFSRDPSEGLLDLCISLESLLDAQTEISFRFATCLTKVTGAKGRRGEDASALLSLLYDLRSKIVHGDPDALKKLKLVEQTRENMNSLAREILVSYVLYLSEHTRKEWSSHIRNVLFE